MWLAVAWSGAVCGWRLLGVVRCVVGGCLEWCGLWLAVAWSGAVCDVTVLRSLLHPVHIGRYMSVCWQQQTRVNKSACQLE